MTRRGLMGMFSMFALGACKPHMHEFQNSPLRCFLSRPELNSTTYSLPLLMCKCGEIKVDGVNAEKMFGKRTLPE